MGKFTGRSEWLASGSQSGANRSRVLQQVQHITRAAGEGDSWEQICDGHADSRGGAGEFTFSDADVRPTAQETSRVAHGHDARQRRQVLRRGEFGAKGINPSVGTTLGTSLKPPVADRTVGNGKAPSKGGIVLLR